MPNMLLCNHLGILKQNVRKLFTYSQTLTLAECCQQLKEIFESRKISEPKESADYIAAHVLGQKTLHGLHGHLSIDECILRKISSLAEQRLLNIPVQYVIGEWDFLDLTLKLRPPVFIPRPETEELVVNALSDPTVLSAKQFLEVGCGSGAICISLLKHLSKIRCTAIEVNADACELTKENALMNDVADRLDVICNSFDSDLVSNICQTRERFDFLISNPPYIPEADLISLQPEIIGYEDHAALDGGPDGLLLIQKILHCAPYLLNNNGSVWLEVDLSHPDKINKMAAYLAKIQYVAAYNDYTNRLRFCLLKTLK